MGTHQLVLVGVLVLEINPLVGPDELLDELLAASWRVENRRSGEHKGQAQQRGGHVKARERKKRKLKLWLKAGMRVLAPLGSNEGGGAMG